MTAFIVYLLKSGLWIILFFVIYWIFLRKETFFRFNRFFLLSGLIFSFLLPAYQFRYPVKIELPANNVNISVATTMPEVASVFDWTTIALAVYFLGVSILFIISLIGFGKVRTLIAKNRIIRDRKYKIVDSTVFNTPFSAFNYIFMDCGSISGTEKKIILDHEQAHIEQYHWIDLMLVRVVCIMQWFNPFLWLYVRAIKQNHEYLADKSVLENGNSAAIYQAVLINHSLKVPVYPFTNSFAYSSTNLKRFKMMRTQLSNPVKKWAVLFLLPLSGLFFWTFAEPEYIIQNQKKPEPVVATTQSKTSDSTENSVVVVGYGKMDDVKIKSNSSKDSNVNITVSLDSTRNAEEAQIPAYPVLKMSDGSKPLLIVDGQVCHQGLEAIDPEKVSSVSVLKDASAVKTYGDAAKNGVIVITSKTPEELAKPVIVSVKSVAPSSPPLYILDGKEVTSIEGIDPKDIESVDVLKNESAIQKFGEKGKNGVVIVTSKLK